MPVAGVYLVGYSAVAVMKTPKRHPADVESERQIARAVYFTACYIGGPLMRITKRFETLTEAMAGAAEITKEHGKFGRQTCIYAITPEGHTFPVGEPYKR